MSSVNKCILIGNLGRAPEVRRMNNGESVVSFSLATSESWRDKATGERKEKIEWHNVVIWNEHIGKVAEQYCKKGSKVYLEGQLQTREFTDKEGNQRKTTEVVVSRFKGELTLLDSPKDRQGDAPGRNDAPRGNGGQRDNGRAPVSPSRALDDDIPFSPEMR